jgi:two-component system, NarL family, response regulator NreC
MNSGSPINKQNESSREKSGAETLTSGYSTSLTNNTPENTIRTPSRPTNGRTLADKEQKPLIGGKTLMLIEPEPLLRKALSMLIESLGGFSVVAEAGSADEALQVLERSVPDLILSELSLPGRSGIELVRELRRRGSTVKSLILTAPGGATLVSQALGAGALGVISRSSTPEELRDALQAAVEDQRYVAQDIRKIGVEVGSYQTGKDDEGDPLGPLSKREREIFHLLADGMQNASIARKLFISPRTVETHRARIVRKLGLHTNGELIRFAIRSGISPV